MKLDVEDREETERSSRPAKMSLRDRFDDIRFRLKGDGVGATVARGASATFMARLAGMIVGFGLNVVLARVLGATDYGTYIYALSWLLLAGLASQLGLRDSIIRFAASAISQRAWGEFRGINRFATRWTLTVSVSSLFVFAGILLGLSETLEPALLRTMALGLLLIPLLGFIGVKCAMLLALASPVFATLSDQVIRPAAILFGVVVVYLVMEQGISPEIAMAVTLAAGVLNLLLCLYFVRISTPSESRGVALDSERKSEWRAVGLSIFLLSAMNLINNRADMLIIGGMLGTTEVGFYAAANRYAQFLPFPLYAINSLAAPMIASLWAEDRRVEIQRVVSLGALAIGCMAIPAAVVLIAAGRRLLGIYGTEFEAGYDALIWLAMGQLAVALGGSVVQLMTMTGHHIPAARIMAASAVLNLTLNVLLIPRFGIAGAGIATASSLIFSNVGMVLFVRRKLGFDPTLFGYLRRPRPKP